MWEWGASRQVIGCPKIAFLMSRIAKGTGFGAGICGDSQFLTLTPWMMSVDLVKDDER